MMDMHTRRDLAEAALAAYDAGAATSEEFVILCQQWAVILRPTDPALADRLAAVR